MSRLVTFTIRNLHLAKVVYCAAVFCFLGVDSVEAATPFTETTEEYFKEKVGAKTADDFCFNYILSIGWDRDKLRGLPSLEKFPLFKSVGERLFLLRTRFIVFYAKGNATDDDLKGPSFSPHAWIEYQYDDEMSEYKGITSCGSSMLYPDEFDATGKKIEQEYFDFRSKTGTVSGWTK
ncbi:hypothetical protein [Mesorhizobium sp. M0244]|uniref:hypothetical protein n=1 Tax=Mesorhizobium sp. M0244 TaxID=2956926 RepID=UPI00333C7545